MRFGCETGDEFFENDFKAVFGFFRTQFNHIRLLANDKFQVGDNVGDQLPVWR